MVDVDFFFAGGNTAHAQQHYTETRLPRAADLVGGRPHAGPFVPGGEPAATAGVLHGASQLPFRRGETTWPNAANETLRAEGVSGKVCALSYKRGQMRLAPGRTPFPSFLLGCGCDVWFCRSHLQPRRNKPEGNS